jgi:hypothetical protein
MIRSANGDDQRSLVNVRVGSRVGVDGNELKFQ